MCAAIGKRYTRDGNFLRDGSGPAMRTKIASFHGDAFSAEREGDELCIYHVGQDAIPTAITGDRRASRSGMTVAGLQRINEKARADEKARSEKLREAAR